MLPFTMVILFFSLLKFPSIHLKQGQNLSGKFHLKRESRGPGLPQGIHSIVKIESLQQILMRLMKLRIFIKFPVTHWSREVVYGLNEIYEKLLILRDIIVNIRLYFKTEHSRRFPYDRFNSFDRCHGTGCPRPLIWSPLNRSSRNRCRSYLYDGWESHMMAAIDEIFFSFFFAAIIWKLVSQ